MQLHSGELLLVYITCIYIYIFNDYRIPAKNVHDLISENHIIYFGVFWNDFVFEYNCPVSTKHLYYIYITSAQRRRHCINLSYQCFVFTGWMQVFSKFRAPLTTHQQVVYINVSVW